MLSLITNNNTPISLKIDGKKYNASLFSMNCWGELLSRLREKRLQEAKELAKGLSPELALPLLREALAEEVDLADGLAFASSPEGLIDVLDISLGGQVDKEQLGSICEGDTVEIGNLIKKILALPDTDTEESEEKEESKKK